MKRIFTLGILLALFAASALAQLSTVTLIGTVSGPDGVLPGATVTVKDNKTNKEINVTSDGEGGFKVPNLEIGLYTVTVAAKGFKTAKVENVKLEVSKDYSLPVALEVGGITEVVTVTAGEELINTVDAQQNGTVSNRELQNLPLLGRNPLAFVPLQAGVASNPAQLSTINGVRTSATNVTIEGINVQDNFIRANATDFSPARPLDDEIDEFAVTGQAGVDKGFGGGQIQFPIRRGGNSFNGSVWEYNRNSELAANDFFSNANTNPAVNTRPYRNRNEFGARVGGPIVKDKFFFFGLYQKTIDIIPSRKLTTVLTPNARAGLFTYTAGAIDIPNGVTAVGQLVTVNILNPTLATGITAINPTIQTRFLNRIPTGNSSDTGDTRVTTGYRFNQNNNSEQTNYTTRLDYTVNSRNAIKGIFRQVIQTVQRADVDGSYNLNPDVDQPSVNPFLSLGVVSTLTSHLNNEATGGFSFSNPFFLNNDTNPTEFITPTLVTNPDDTFVNQGRTAKSVNFQDNATYIMGNHAIRFGGQFEAIRINAFNFAGAVPTYTIGVSTATPQISTGQFTNTALFPGTVPTAQRATANALLALLGGIVTGSTQTFNATSLSSGYVPGASNARRFETEIYGFYGVDQWRVRPNLTVNFGLRYDLYTALRNPQQLFLEPTIAPGANPVTTILNSVGTYQTIGGNAGQAGAFFKTDKNNFAPNVSFAWTPNWGKGFGKMLFGNNGDTTFRGGYRISYINDEFVTSANNAGVGNAGLSTAVSTTSLNARVGALPAIATPVYLANRTFATNNSSAFNFFGTVYAINPDLKTPFVQEYSIGVQRSLTKDMVLEVRYVGSKSDNLLRAIDYNQVKINSNGFTADFNRARSNLLLCNSTPGCATGGGFNAAVPGSQALTIYPLLASGGLLTNSTITGQLVSGTPADQVITYIQNGLLGAVAPSFFLPNGGTGVVDYLDNAAKSRYNSLQVELRRRFSQGLFLEANYTFAKNLTDSNAAQTNGTGDTQNRFDPLLDNANPSLEFSRAITDQTHKLNILTQYELPFGKGKSFFNKGGITDTLLGGFSVSAIIQMGSGAPITITDARGTLNRVGRSNRQTALTNLTKQQLKDLVGVFRTPNGIFFINPTALGRNPDGTLQTGRTGRGADGFGTATFTGQAFFNNVPGNTSGLERAFLNGPSFYEVDLAVIKDFRFGEKYSFRIQADAFNLLNTTNFVVGQFQDINSTSFGRVTGAFSPRIVQVSGRFSF